MRIIMNEKSPYNVMKGILKEEILKKLIDNDESEIEYEYDGNLINLENWTERIIYKRQRTEFVRCLR